MKSRSVRAISTAALLTLLTACSSSGAAKDAAVDIVSPSASVSGSAAASPGDASASAASGASASAGGGASGAAASDPAGAPAASGAGDTAGGAARPTTKASGGGRIDLATDVAVDGRIAQPLGSVAYTFAGVKGQEITVTVASANGACETAGGAFFGLTLKLVDDAGDSVGQANPFILGCRAYGPYKLPHQGTYTVKFVAGSGVHDSGTFTGVIRRLARTTTPIVPSAVRPAPVQGRLTQPLGEADFIFTGKKGDGVAVTVTAAGGGCKTENQGFFGLTIEVLDDTGERVGQGNAFILGCRAYGPFTLRKDGKHTVRFISGSGPDDAGTFAATVGVV